MPLTDKPYRIKGRPEGTPARALSEDRQRLGRGMRDLLPADIAARDHLLAAITCVYQAYGYQRIETPALENISRLQSGQGADNEKLIFQVLKRGLPQEVEPGIEVRDLSDLGLRNDLIVPLTRFYGQHRASLPVPLWSLQADPVWPAKS